MKNVPTPYLRRRLALTIMDTATQTYRDLHDQHPGGRGDIGAGSRLVAEAASANVCNGSCIYSAFCSSTTLCLSQLGKPAYDGPHIERRIKGVLFLYKEGVVDINGCAELWQRELEEGERRMVSDSKDYPILALASGLTDEKHQSLLGRFVPSQGEEFRKYLHAQKVWAAVGVKLFTERKSRVPTRCEETGIVEANAAPFRAFYVLKKQAMKELVTYEWEDEVLRFHRDVHREQEALERQSASVVDWIPEFAR